jgi:ketosteroid isomerase-like protein
MSEETMQLARRAYEAFNARDWEAFSALMDPDVVVESRLVAMEGGYSGYEGLRRWRDAIVEMLPDYTLELEELRDMGDVTLARARGFAHGGSSGAPVIDPFWQPIQWRDGKCVWWRNCSTEAEALEAIAERTQA